MLNTLNDIMDKVDQYQLPEMNDIMSPELFTAIENLKSDAELLKTNLLSMQEELDKAKQLIEKAEGILAQVDEIQKTVNEINIDSIMNDATSRVTTAAKAVIEEEKDKISTNILVKKVINDYLTEEKENE